MNVQNRVAIARAKLPPDVIRQGLSAWRDRGFPVEPLSWPADSSVG